MALITRAQWNARPPQKSIPDNKPTHLEVHHGASSNRSAVADPASVWRGYQNLHLDKKRWSDLFYHWGLAPDSDLYEGRDPTKRSAGTALTVCLMGNYELVDIKPELLVVIKRLAEGTEAGVAGIDWHRRRAMGTKYASACPGKFVIKGLKTLIDGSHIPIITQEEQTMAGSVVVPLEDAIKIVDDTYMKAWGHIGDVPGSLYWTQVVHETGFAGYANLVNALDAIGK